MPLDLTPKTPPYYTIDGQLPTNTTILTDAQIKTLPTTYVQILPPPGTNKLYLIQTAMFDLNFTAGAYTNLDAGGHAIQLVLGEWLAELTNYIQIQSSASRQIGIANTFTKVNEIPTLADYTTGVRVVSTDMLNQPIKLVAYNNVSGNFTGGNPANTIAIAINYQIITLA